MPCTTILVGKNASYDGSTLMARNEDSGSGEFTAKKFIAVLPKDQPRHYRSVISGVRIELPDDPQRYTAMPNALPDEGIWGEAGFNESGVAMSETETLTSNARVLGEDPLVKTGIGEEDLLTIVLPYIRTAREGVLRLGRLTEEFGTYEMNGIGFQDQNEIWWFESVGGHHWIAKRVPDNSYVVMPNQQGIDSFDLKDAFGEKKDHLCSDDLLSFIQKGHLDLSFREAALEDETDFDARAAFGSHSDSDHTYNTPRAWYMLRYFNRNTVRFDGPDATYRPDSDDLPWSMVPEQRITIEDIKYILSSYYQGTAYDPYSTRSGDSSRGRYRPIGINRNNFLAITQFRPYLPKEIAAVEWIAEGSNTFNAAVPFYAGVRRTPSYLANASGDVTTENFYWANRLIGALADPHYSACIAHIERYQLKMASLGHQLLKSYDEEFLQNPPEDIPVFLEKCNDELAEKAKKETSDLLGKVLYTASCEMKNGFSRSDA